MLKLGKIIFESAKKAYPILLNGKSSMGKKALFSLKNPYILEAIPESKLAEMSMFEGKKLNTVCRILDDKDGYKVIERYNKIKSKQTKGFSDGELAALYKKACKYDKQPSPFSNNDDAKVYLSFLPESIGSKFDAHGITKNPIEDHLSQLNNLLTKGIDKSRNFHSAPLVGNPGLGPGLGTAGGSAYRDGSFIIVSDKSKTLLDDGIKHVIVNDVYYDIIKDLQAKFLNVNFVRADQAVEYFSKL